MQLYDTLSQSVKDFVVDEEPVTVYICGITPYDTTHLGHAFTYLSADVLIRYLEFLGHEVRYVQNVTDIDDDILRRAAEVGEDWQVLGNRWTAHFIRDMQALNVRPPDSFPRATDAIPEIILVVQRLLEAGVAYEAGGNVYFHVDSWPEYGELSRLTREEMLPIANERGNDPDDPYKRDPLDFVLWQASKSAAQAGVPDEPAWESPWGPGRPGWHIECSTMAIKHLGGTIDVHGGGRDLIFPHHESEIAQAEWATGRQPFVRFWMHTAMVRHEGEKMSKSLGNLVMVRDLLEDWSPDALRLYLAAYHYRESWSHNVEGLARAERLAQKLRAAATSEGGDGTLLSPASARTAFRDAMDADLRTPVALKALERLADDILLAAGSDRTVRGAQEALGVMGRVFGLRLDSTEPEPRVVREWGTYLSEFSNPSNSIPTLAT
jgi:L-cysteine:1D-myo-inositol 2-amino-2-deoxy-alpha-D-glucopyranoside ligase